MLFSLLLPTQTRKTKKEKATKKFKAKNEDPCTSHYATFTLLVWILPICEIRFDSVPKILSANRSDDLRKLNKDKEKTNEDDR